MYIDSLLINRLSTIFPPSIFSIVARTSLSPTTKFIEASFLTCRICVPKSKNVFTRSILSLASILVTNRIPFPFFPLLYITKNFLYKSKNLSNANCIPPLTETIDKLVEDSARCIDCFTISSRSCSILVLTGSLSCPLLFLLSAP